MSKGGKGKGERRMGDGGFGQEKKANEVVRGDLTDKKIPFRVLCKSFTEGDTNNIGHCKPP